MNEDWLGPISTILVVTCILCDTPIRKVLLLQTTIGSSITEGRMETAAFRSILLTGEKMAWLRTKEAGAKSTGEAYICSQAISPGPGIVPAITTSLGVDPCQKVHDDKVTAQASYNSSTRTIRTHRGTKHKFVRNYVMAPLLRRRLRCFFCGYQSKQKGVVGLQQWQCETCEAVNHLDEVCLLCFRTKYLAGVRLILATIEWRDHRSSSLGRSAQCTICSDHRTTRSSCLHCTRRNALLQNLHHKSALPHAGARIVLTFPYRSQVSRV